jgi:hypothetical protein
MDKGEVIGLDFLEREALKQINHSWKVVFGHLDFIVSEKVTVFFNDLAQCYLIVTLDDVIVGDVVDKVALTT